MSGIDDTYKKRERLIKELEDARKRIADLEISERLLRSTERALSHTQKRYSLVTEHTTEMIWTVDLVRPGQITYISPSVSHLLGYTIPEAMLKTMAEIFTPESAQSVMTLLEDMSTRNKTKLDLTESRTLELIMRHKDGSLVPVEIKYSLLPGPDRFPSEILGVARVRTKPESPLKEENMVTEKDRMSGINTLGNIRWGTHFCQFYQTKEDLLDILIPYFKAGLENNEFCMWITSDPLKEQEAKEVLRKAVSDFDNYFTRGQIEILPHDRWYLKDGVFSSDRALGGVIEKLNQALVKGFNGLRITGNEFWLGKEDWKSFVDYEAVVNNVIGSYQVIALCSYCLDKLESTEVIDVVRNHQHVLSWQENTWQAIKKEWNTPVKAIERRRWKKKPQAMLTVGQAAEFLGVHVNTVRRWSEMGILKCSRLGNLGHRRFLQEDLERIIKQ